MAANFNHFELTLDTLAPSGSITRPAQYVNAQTTLTIAKGDATFMYVWTDTTASPTAMPTGTSVIPAAESWTTSFAADGVYYGHLILEDSVGNQSEIYSTASITYDTTKPTVESCEITLRDGTKTELTKTREVAVVFEFDDNLSGCVSCAISGDINAESTAWSTALTAEEIAAKKATRNIVLSGTGEEQATKTVNITVTDASGNTSTAGSDTIVLDTQFLTGTIIVKDSTGTTTINEQWVNYNSIKVMLTLGEATSDDVVGYKVWGDINTDGGASTTTEPTSYTSVTKGTNPIDAKIGGSAIKFTSGDNAAKYVYAKVIDDAGNETTLTEVFVKVDYTAPTKDGSGKPVIVCDKTYVSKVTGFNTATFTPTVNYDIAGAKQYQWYMNGAEFAGTGGSGTGAAVALTVNATDLGEGGAAVAKVFTLKVTDNAGNEVTTDGVTLYLDTVAPAKQTLAMEAWYNRDDADQTTYKKFSTCGVTASATDGGAGMAYMTLWCDQSATTTTIPTSAEQKSYSADPTHDMVDWTGVADSNTNYIHVQYVDAVGNTAIYHSDAFGVDRINPTKGTIAFTKEAYPSTSASVVLDFSDTVSGMGSGAKFKVWGDITSAATEAAATWEAIATSKAVTLTTGDGNKDIYVRYMDVAGNISGKGETGTAADPATDNTELDTSKPSATVVLKVSGTETAKPATSNVAESDLRVTCSEATTGKEFYQV